MTAVERKGLIPAFPHLHLQSLFILHPVCINPMQHCKSNRKKEKMDQCIRSPDNDVALLDEKKAGRDYFSEDSNRLIEDYLRISLTKD